MKRIYGSFATGASVIGVVASFLVAVVTPNTARAGDPPVIRLSLDLPHGDGTSANGAGPAAPFDGELPAGEPFDLEIANPGNRFTGGILEVWPKPPGSGASCGSPGGKQHHRLAFASAGTEVEPTLRVHVPPLQVDYPFCFRVSRFTPLSPAQLDRLVELAALSLQVDMERVLRDVPHFKSYIEEELGRALAEVAQSSRYRGDVGDAAADATNAFLALGYDVSLQHAAATAAIAEKTLQERQRAFETLIASFAGDVAPAPDVKLKKDGGASGQSETIAWTTFASNPVAAGLTPAIVAKQLEDQQAPPAFIARVKARLAAIDSAQAEVDHARAKNADARAASKALAARMQDDLNKVLRNDALRSLRVSVTAAEMFSTPVSSDTGNIGNYVIPDVGVVAGIPYVDGAWWKGDPWVLPYFALNIYSTQVDRKIAFEDLAGGRLLWLRQRLSLSLGVTLHNPGLAARTVNPIFGSQHPLAAAGFRMTQFIRFTTGAIVFRVDDRNPVSRREHYGATVFVGLSLDADFLSIAKTGLGGI